MARFTLVTGFAEADRPALVGLLRAYETAIGMSLQFQDFEAELAGLPGHYAAPTGALITAREVGLPDLCGCVAVRAVPGSPGLCEMKRLYVSPSVQGEGLGRTLALAAMAEGRRLGYSRMCLDTLPTLAAAQSLYRSLGFNDAGTAGTAPRVMLFERKLDLV